jgi:desumoylating isopeptidase 1
MASSSSSSSTGKLNNNHKGSGWPVQLYVYDLSHGLARSMSGALLGKQIDGIWHTGIVVYGVEYFYGGGIQYATPGQSMAGQPTKIEE